MPTISSNLADIKISLKSGRVTGNAKNFNDRLAAIQRRAVRTGLERAWVRRVGTIARKTGQLRAGVRQMIFGQLKSVINRHFFRLRFDMKQLDALVTGPEGQKYARYHVREDPKFNFGGGYKQPTTTGTKPLSAQAFMIILKREIEKAYNQELQRAGFKFRVRVKATRSGTRVT